MGLRVTAAFFAVMVFLGIAPVQAQQGPIDILRTLNFKAGSIILGDNLATIEQTQNFRFLNNADTQTFLTRIWGNPPGAGRDALGMIIPTDVPPLGEGGWAIVIAYDGSGYVSDEEAGKIDYDELMTQMQKATAEASKERVGKGQDSVELLGWAKKPYYDSREKKLYWAKSLRFGGSSKETLNYEIRILGRRGVLSLHIIASMSVLPAIDRRVSDILAMTRFNRGNTYAEFNPSVDEAAAYGLAGLIAGGVLTKTGFLKGLVALLFASKKLLGGALVGAVAAIWGGIKAFLRWKSSQHPPSA